eukprot:CAMPEP_0177701930 /NCGR_PEP_ID=MMETSP0484_2-20121128/6871_1 /TAXON_ID=354590 /ORGANISM="Rhodomonas lens, Strain RHODO" /LENGTH=272 /DNA_ID=CAMNT_0019213191 /DNA_START=151 /DNA_END=966 /DNA_ORIENTATION=+
MHDTREVPEPPQEGRQPRRSLEEPPSTNGEEIVLPPWPAVLQKQKRGSHSRTVSPRFERDETAIAGSEEVVMDMGSLFPLNNEAHPNTGISVSVPLLVSGTGRNILPHLDRARYIANGNHQHEKKFVGMSLKASKQQSETDVGLQIEERLHSRKSSGGDSGKSGKSSEQSRRHNWWFLSPSPVSTAFSDSCSEEAGARSDRLKPGARDSSSAPGAHAPQHRILSLPVRRNIPPPDEIIELGDDESYYGPARPVLVPRPFPRSATLLARGVGG